MKQYPDRILHVEAPRKGHHLIGWYKELQQKIRTDTRRPHRQSAGVRQPETTTRRAISTSSSSPITALRKLIRSTPNSISTCAGRRMWLWDPMTGERALLPDTGTRLKLPPSNPPNRGCWSSTNRSGALRPPRPTHGSKVPPNVGPCNWNVNAQPLRRHRRRTRKPTACSTWARRSVSNPSPARSSTARRSTSVPANARHMEFGVEKLRFGTLTSTA